MAERPRGGEGEVVSGWHVGRMSFFVSCGGDVGCVILEGVRVDIDIDTDIDINIDDRTGATPNES